MPPRKTADSDAEPPRRSARVAALPKEEESKPKTVRKASSSKKRPAETEEAVGAESSTAKKAKATETESDEEAQESTPLSPVDIGDILPSVTLKNEKGEDVDVAGLTTDKGLILFLVPKADTPGCTNQACGFRDIYPDFTALNYEVYCLSADTPSAQSKWQAKKELPYPLLSDPKRILIAALGAADGGKTKRSHFIFGKGGKLLEKKIPVKPVDSPKLALEFIKSQ